MRPRYQRGKPRAATIRTVHLLNADLHSHSSVSDGTLSPEDLAQRAADGGVELWALTDHDEVRGIARAREAALSLGMAFVSGVEVSVSFCGETVHIVGLGIDEADPDLVAGLHAMRAGRSARAREMGESLARAGIAGAYEGALKHVANPDLVSRTHFARHLVERGVCSHTHEVFQKYLTPGKPGFVQHQWASLADAVRWIRGAGGLAVIAHPGRYKFTANEDYALFSEFKAHGGAGVEVITGSHGVADQQRYAETAIEFDLAASRGSDFHSPRESRTELGRLPDLPGRLRPVWTLLGARIDHPAGAVSEIGALA
jgi:predicted metal-dependent phosphoesterase TrpH